jgi:hypothetical protein
MVLFSTPQHSIIHLLELGNSFLPWWSLMKRFHWPSISSKCYNVFTHRFVLWAIFCFVFCLFIVGVIVVTYSQFDSNIRVFYVFLGFFKNNLKYFIQRPIFKPLYFYNVFFKYLKILLFEHLRKILVFGMWLLWLGS